MDLKKIAKDFFLGVHYTCPGKRIEVINESCAENVIVYSGLEPEIDALAFANHAEGFLCAIPDACYKRLDVHRSESTVCISFCLSGTHLGDHLYGIEPTMQKVEFNAVSTMDFDDAGKIQKYQFHLDFMNLFEQLNLPTEGMIKLIYQLSKSEKDVLQHAFQKLGLSALETLCLGYTFAGLDRKGIAHRLGLYKANIDACFEKIHYCLGCRKTEEVMEYLDSISYRHILKEYSKKLISKNT